MGARGALRRGDQEKPAREARCLYGTLTGRWLGRSGSALCSWLVGQRRAAGGGVAHPCFRGTGCFLRRREEHRPTHQERLEAVRRVHEELCLLRRRRSAGALERRLHRGGHRRGRGRHDGWASLHYSQAHEEKNWETWTTSRIGWQACWRATSTTPRSYIMRTPSKRCLNCLRLTSSMRSSSRITPSTTTCRPPNTTTTSTE